MTECSRLGLTDSIRTSEPHLCTKLLVRVRNYKIFSNLAVLYALIRLRLKKVDLDWRLIFTILSFICTQNYQLAWKSIIKCFQKWCRHPSQGCVQYFNNEYSTWTEYSRLELTDSTHNSECYFYPKLLTILRK